MSRIPLSKRKESTRPVNKTMLIVCEGERTEPNYFNAFRLPGSMIEIVGSGKNTESLVNHTIKLKTKNSYDEVWCVFDRDSFSQQQVNNAFQLMRANSFNHAYTNEAFELWYLLHFCYLDARISRTDYCDRLSKHLGVDYKKNDPKIYEVLKPFQDNAIRNATRLYNQMTSGGAFIQNSAPITTVHELVVHLNDLVATRNIQLENS